MIKFDKLKIITPIKNVEILNVEDECKYGYTATMQNGIIIRKKIKMETPCLLEINANLQKDKVSIEFTAKILKDNYSLLISLNTIRKCLEAINQLDVCRLNVDGILKDAYVVKCDVTKDVFDIDLPGMKDYISSHISNYNQWKLKPMKNKDNVIIEREVVTPRHKRRLTIYNKEEEMSMSKNKDFLAWANNRVKDYFKGVTRFELNLTTCHAIRSVLNIEDTNLATVLYSDADPIVDMLDGVLRADTHYTSNITKLSDYDKEITMTYHDWNMEAIEKIARQIYKKKYHKNKLLPYQRLLDKHNQNLTYPMREFDYHSICSFNCSEETEDIELTPVSKDYWVTYDLFWHDAEELSDFDFIRH